MTNSCGTSGYHTRFQLRSVANLRRISITEVGKLFKVGDSRCVSITGKNEAVGGTLIVGATEGKMSFRLEEGSFLHNIRSIIPTYIHGHTVCLEVLIQPVSCDVLISEVLNLK